MNPTLLLSDVHLDSTRPETLRLFIELLAEWRGRTSALYILGDLVEYWLGDDQVVGDLEPAFQAIRELTGIS